MREAQAADYWRRLYLRPYETAVENVSFTGVGGFGDGELVLQGPLTVICGGNGAGKTTLLEAVLKSIDARRSRVLGSACGRFDNATLAMAGRSKGAPLTRVQSPTTDLQAQQHPIVDITFLDPAAESKRIAGLVNAIAHFEEILEGLSPRLLDAKELQHLSYLAGKTYSHCQVYEIDDIAGEEIFPYFRVADAGGAYGTEGMGLGELSLLVVQWHLTRVPRDSVVLIEEPETHLAPRSQEALMNSIARTSVERGLWVILTTHAPAIMRRVPREHTRLVVRTGAGSTITHNPERYSLDAILGIRSQFQGVILVEDRAAREFARSLFDRIAPDIRRTYQIVDVGSSGRVVAALNSFPRAIDWISLVGLLDGDQRDAKHSTSWPCGFLPGRGGPEALLRASIDTEKLCDLLGRKPAELVAALSAIEGRDEHDWLEELSKAIGQPYETLISILTVCWLDTEGAAQEGATLVDFINGSAV